jgi:beta-1,2-mannobiose phosphorylase / 1,2-beta-oligomannan phosphorylase
VQIAKSILTNSRTQEFKNQEFKNQELQGQELMKQNRKNSEPQEFRTRTQNPKNQEGCQTMNARVDVTVERKGVVLFPSDDASEADGVLNPASTTGLDGVFRLFPRCVAKGNISSVGKVTLDDASGVYKRDGFALVPQGTHEIRAGGYGTEDPRITYVKPLNKWIMAYVATGDHNGHPGCRIGLAVSDDGENFTRVGIVQMRQDWGLPENNKDAAFFPEAVYSPSGELCLAFYERNMAEYPPEPGEHWVQPILRQPFSKRQSIGLLYVPLTAALADINALLNPTEHAVVMCPDDSWGGIKLGCGTPPVRTNEGWMSIYHGIDAVQRDDGSQAIRYSAGIMIHDVLQPHKVLFRSPVPILVPQTPEELSGYVNNVVFPTAIRERVDLGKGIFDVYYGMADSKIGMFRLYLLKHPRRSGQHVRQI